MEEKKEKWKLWGLNECLTHNSTCRKEKNKSKNPQSRRVREPVRLHLYWYLVSSLVFQAFRLLTETLNRRWDRFTVLSLLQRSLSISFGAQYIKFISLKMAAVAVHQFAQCITCHAWSPDHSSNFILSFNLFLSKFHSLSSSLCFGWLLWKFRK